MADEIEILKTNPEWCDEHHRYKVVLRDQDPYCPTCTTADTTAVVKLNKAKLDLELEIERAIDKFHETTMDILRNVRRPN